jgi:hypothetical protein
MKPLQDRSGFNPALDDPRLFGRGTRRRFLAAHRGRARRSGIGRSPLDCPFDGRSKIRWRRLAHLRRLCRKLEVALHDNAFRRRFRG